ncbi:fungal chitosanase of glycosyl hydrolase group 75-domain-containing protein [Thelonectria olida]|uniref:Endo-chitosanase n=1 Tax=Thelonectria olida TaxID=1576542 RepID=A0A9P8W021_9HYPO|nr:fungal chitosanase of glycosyl hydrolase group 75-domain-containing protein [Thelonectria olida]
MHSLLPLASLLLASSATALKVPDNLETFFKDLKTKGECSDKLAGGFYNTEFDNGNTAYCGDHLEDYGIVYLQANKGRFSNMDIDCDGEQGGPQDDGRCDVTTTTQERTSVKATIQSYNAGISDLNPHVHSYVVFGNDGFNDPYSFDPREWGVHQTSVMAVVCGDQMFYGIWGDVNGGDSPRPSVGEVSLSLATACYGKNMSSSDGDGTSHNAEDVLYLAFIGEDAVPGASCESANDCADSLTCTNGKCAERTS